MRLTTPEMQKRNAQHNTVTLFLSLDNLQRGVRVVVLWPSFLATRVINVDVLASVLNAAPTIALTFHRPYCK
jgi:hypothetical protein